jgi:hypothetical protein
MYVTVLLHGAFYAEYLLQSFGRHFSPPCCMLCKTIAGEQSLLNRKHFLTSPDLRMRRNIRQGDRLTKKRRDLLWLVEPVFPQVRGPAVWRSKTNKSIYPQFFHIIAFVIETFVPAVPQVVICRAKESRSRGLQAPPSVDFISSCRKYFRWNANGVKRWKSPVNAMSGLYGGRLHFLQNCSRGLLWHKHLKGGVNVERDLVLYEHYRVPFSNGCFQVPQALYSTCLHLLIPVV